MLRLSAAALVLAVCACEPDLPQVQPTPTVTAMFDPTKAQIPLPNDLVFFNPINSVCPAPANGLTAPSDPPACAQAELLAAFNHAFPSDQEVAITIDFTETTYVNGRPKQSAPDLDLTTITPATLVVVGPSGPMQLQPITSADYNKGAADADHGTLTLHNLNHQPWPTGQYALVMRGGDMGVKTTDKIPVTPSTVFDLIEQGKDMTLPENLGLLKAQNNGSTALAVAQGQQLNLLIALYKASVFPAADQVAQFPHEQLAIASTFAIGATVTNVTVDPARGLAPLPFDLLRDATTGKITPTAACGLAGSSLNPDGTCMSPAAAGFTTLDGFSTTGAILAPTSDLVDVTTVTKNSLMLFDLSQTPPAQVSPNDLIIEPCEFTSQFNGTSCNAAQTPKLAPVIAFQPAGATSDQAPPPNGQNTPLPSLFRTKPLKDNTDYAVVMTKDIKDKSGNSLQPGTVAKILRFQNPVLVGGHSALQGIDDGTASSLEKMRKQLQPVLALPGIAANVSTAYTFHTQTVLSPAVQLAALPYTAPDATAIPKTDTPLGILTPPQAFTKFGVPAGVPNTDIDEILEADITTFNALDPATGAFLADPTKAALETIHVLIATPQLANVTASCPPPGQALKCAPLMVFRHGLGRGRVDMLLIANTFAKAGMVTVAIDAAKHGDRSLCSPGGLTFGPLMGHTGCVGTCNPIAGAVGQGDPNPPGPPGTCDAMGLVKFGLDGSPVTTPDKDGLAGASSNYLVSANFFRTRDTLRQDLIDESQLIRVMAFKPPATPGATGHVVFDHMALRGVIIDPATVYFTGQSLGAIQGTMDVATNPRISKAGLNVGGGTITDIFTTSPAFAPQVNALLAGLHIDRVANPSQFLQFLTVAKTVLDPADPVNFAGHLTANTLPNLLPPLGGNPNGTVPQTAKNVLVQLANCDQVVPNVTGVVWASNLLFAGVSPGPLPAANIPFEVFVGPGFTDPTTQFLNAAACTSSPTIGVPHGFLIDPTNATLAQHAQDDLTAFIKSDTLPPPFRQ
ncbi:MAG TPA: hypothetical protein VHW23_10965 [Kofleriaceae bacterium]|nr:hypothetical protein [Kofleriaceae bacterium]